MAFWESLGNILSVGAPIAGALRSRPRASDVPATGQLAAQTQQANRMSMAAVDPNSPLYRNLLRLEEESGRVDIAKAVNEMLRQRQRAVRKFGATRYGARFNPEREDEALSSAIAREGANVGERARGNVRNTLLQGASATQGGMPGLTNLAQLQGAQAQQRRGWTSDLFGAIGQAGRWLGSGQQQGTNQEQKKQTSLLQQIAASRNPYRWPSMGRY